MGGLTHLKLHVAPKAHFTANITDMIVIDTKSGPVLITTSNKGAGFSSYRVNKAGEGASYIDVKPPKDSGTYYSAPKLEVIDTSSGPMVLSTGQHGAVYKGLSVSEATGALKSYHTVFGPDQIPANTVLLHAVSAGRADYLLAANDGDMRLSLYRRDGVSVSRLDTQSSGSRAPTDAEYTDLETISIGSRTFAFAASAQGNRVDAFSIDSKGLTLMGGVGAANTVGISAPREVEAVTTSAGRFLIVSGGESSSLSVFRIDSAGGVTLTDHVVDSTSTRFESVTAMTTVEMGGRAYVIAGGGDDGISVMTLDAQGRLILLGSIEDTHKSALANVSAIEAKVVGGKIVIFVASATDNGISQLEYAPGAVGSSVVGTGRVWGTGRDDILIGTGTSSHVMGGAGDDVLIARTGKVVLTGGAGSDVFVPGYGTTSVTISDFEPGRDVLDFSELAFIRSLAQLRIVSTSTGAYLMAGPIQIEILTASGTPISSERIRPLPEV